jgi:glutamyl/glutaminyl-tRNA synthetase
MATRVRSPGTDFGDFLVWRKDDLPSYQLACVVDDAAMQVTEVVRGADLITSTFRQLLLYRALGLVPPASSTVRSLPTPTARGSRNGTPPPASADSATPDTIRRRCGSVG